MPCAVDRSLAVICYDNALRLLTLEGTEARLVPVANDYLPSIAGGQLSTVEPSPTEHELCYLQSRRLVLFDMVTRTHQAYRVIDDVDMEQIAMAGALASRSPTVVIAQVEDTTHYGKDGHVDARLLSCEIGPRGIVKHGTLELEQDAEKELDWGAGRGLVVAYKNGYLEVYDALLVPRRCTRLARRSASSSRSGAPFASRACDSTPRATWPSLPSWRRTDKGRGPTVSSRRTSAEDR